MQSQGCAPDGITYSALITAYDRAGQWRRALGAYDQMLARGCHPDSAVYNALLGACWSCGVAAAQMRASLIWSAANRSGHFRIYHQSRSEAAALHYSCVVFTAGAALVTLLRWLVDIRWVAAPPLPGPSCFGAGAGAWGVPVEAEGGGPGEGPAPSLALHPFGGCEGAPAAAARE
jgi:pentatricopeptide repeat protein